MPDNVYAKVPEFDQITEMVLQLNPVVDKDTKYYPCVVVKVVPDIKKSEGVYEQDPLAPKLTPIVSKEGTYDKAALVTAKCVIREVVAVVDEKPVEEPIENTIIK